MSKQKDTIRRFQEKFDNIASTQNPEKQNPGKKDPEILIAKDDQTNQRVANLRNLLPDFVDSVVEPSILKKPEQN